MVWLKSVKFQADTKDLACPKDLTILSMASRYNKPVQYRRMSALKAGNRELLPHLESTCMRFNTSARRRTRPSAGSKRSQQLQILPSLNSEAILQRTRLLFLLRQRRRVPSFSRAPTFLQTPIFFQATRFWHLPKIFDAPRFWHPPKILEAPMFLYPPRFLRRLYFCVFFLHSYLVCGNNLIGANILRLSG